MSWCPQRPQWTRKTWTGCSLLSKIHNCKFSKNSEDNNEALVSSLALSGDQSRSTRGLYQSIDERHTSLSLPSSTVLALINHCAQQMVSELVLLVPLLHRLRQPGADAAKVGPVVQEENWSGLDHVRFSRFRENLQPYPDKRK